MVVKEKEELVFFGPGMSTQEMDVEFKKLYDSLITYKSNIFHLVDTVCNDCDAGVRLAMNIAERDSALLQRLVAKECEQRRMLKKAQKESVLDQLRGKTGIPSVDQVLAARDVSLKNDVRK
ncbi:MAG TPA: hypothetical protein VGB32_00395 [Candidatus Bathyarchaeia archaeon]